MLASVRGQARALASVTLGLSNPSPQGFRWTAHLFGDGSNRRPCEGCSLVWSNTMRTARSRSSGAYLVGRATGHTLSRNVPSDKPGTVQLRDACGVGAAHSHQWTDRTATWAMTGSGAENGRRNGGRTACPGPTGFRSRWPASALFRDPARRDTARKGEVLVFARRFSIRRFRIRGY